ncbi:MAG: TetR/AcrR family transcriptional regulator [Phenylobacterium sp.]|nr:TetR/AcrR family transcriptional regulator [Phenylobacterium sp.]
MSLSKVQRAQLPAALQFTPRLGHGGGVFKSLEEHPPNVQRLMTTAERLYGQHGLDGISLRQIVTAAGQGNNYAVQHHFGSKLGLIQAVSEMRLSALEAERQVMLDAASRDGDRSLERMLGVMLMPLVTVLNKQDLEHYARFMLAVMHLDPQEHPFMQPSNISPVSTVVRSRVAECLPQLPADVLRRRLSLAIGLFLNAASQLGGKLTLGAGGYSSRSLFFQDVFQASLVVLAAPFPPVGYRAGDLEAIGEGEVLSIVRPNAVARRT